MEFQPADFLSVMSDIQRFASTKQFLSGLGVGAALVYFGKRFFDWYLAKPMTRRVEREKRRLAAYEEIRDLVWKVGRSIWLVKFSLSRWDPAKDTGSASQSSRKNQDVKMVLPNHILSLDDLAELMIRINESLINLEDEDLREFVGHWFAALSGCTEAQHRIMKSQIHKMTEVNLVKNFEIMHEFWEDEDKTRKALLEYLKSV